MIGSNKLEAGGFHLKQLFKRLSSLHIKALLLVLVDSELLRVLRAFGILMLCSVNITDQLQMIIKLMIELHIIKF